MGMFVVSSGSSASNKKELRRVFEQHGKEESGSIRLNQEQLKSAFEYLGALMPGYKAASALKYIDTDKSGYVEGEELEALVEYAYSFGYHV